MKQTTLAITAITSLLSTTLGLSETRAAALATDFIVNNAPANLSVKQQKAVFAFSHDRASLTTGLIERWSESSPEARKAMTAEFVEAFFAAVRTHQADDSVMSDVGLSVLMADALGNAKALLMQKGAFASEALNRTVDEIKAEVMRVCYESRGEVVIPYIPEKLAWGQHGQHFVRRDTTSPRKPPPRGGNPRR